MHLAFSHKSLHLERRYLSSWLKHHFDARPNRGRSESILDLTSQIAFNSSLQESGDLCDCYALNKSHRPCWQSFFLRRPLRDPFSERRVSRHARGW